MRELSLKDYAVKMKAPDNMKPGEVIEYEIPYPVRDSIVNIMFRKQLGLTGAELVKQNMLAMKIEASKDDTVLLEEEEYQRLKEAFDKCTGFTRADVELVTRINEVQEVEVAVKN